VLLLLELPLPLEVFVLEVLFDKLPDPTPEALVVALPPMAVPPVARPLVALPELVAEPP